MKVCHITTVHKSKDIRIFFKECKSLTRAGYNVNLIVINGENFTEDGVEVIGVPFQFKNRFQRFIKATRAAYNKAIDLNAEIYHFHDPEFLPFAAKLVRKGKKVVYDVHEDLPRQILSKYYLNKMIRGITAWIVEKAEVYYSKKINSVITATDFIQNRFLSFHPSVASVKNYPILEHAIIHKTEKTHTNEICYIGGLDEVRGIIEMVDAMSFTDRNTQLNLAGSFSPENLRERVITSKGWAKVNELGFISRAEVFEILSRSIAGLVTLHPVKNYLDALPVKMFEYMSAGIPVIASDFPLWKKIVEGNNCGICVDPLNSEEIANAINFLVNNPDKAVEMGKNGLRAVKKKYNWGIEEKKLIKVYKNLHLIK